MSKRVQLRRGTTAQHAGFAGALAELTYDTDKNAPVIHDGATAGGFPLLRLDAAGNYPSDFGLAPNKLLKINSNQVVGGRKAGWSTPTGTTNRTAFDTNTVTLSQLAEHLKALIDDLTSHGLIGP